MPNLDELTVKECEQADSPCMIKNIGKTILSLFTPIYSGTLERKKVQKYLLKLLLHPAPISVSYGSDFAYRLYPSIIVKRLKIKFSQKELERFFVKFWI